MDNNGGVVIVLDITMFQCVASKWMAAIIGDRFMEFMSFCFRVKVLDGVTRWIAISAIVVPEALSTAASRTSARAVRYDVIKATVLNRSRDVLHSHCAYL